jgi:hypothetical protein
VAPEQAVQIFALTRRTLADIAGTARTEISDRLRLMADELNASRRTGESGHHYDDSG